MCSAESHALTEFSISFFNFRSGFLKRVTFERTSVEYYLKPCTRLTRILRKFCKDISYCNFASKKNSKATSKKQKKRIFAQRLPQTTSKPIKQFQRSLLLLAASFIFNKLCEHRDKDFGVQKKKKEKNQDSLGLINFPKKLFRIMRVLLDMKNKRATAFFFCCLPFFSCFFLFSPQYTSNPADDL